VSREDALSDRLKNLRLQQDSGLGTSTTSHRRKAEQRSSTVHSEEPTPSVQQSVVEGKDSKSVSPEKPVPARQADVDALLETDDQTLTELLDELHEDDGWLEQVAAEVEHGNDHHKVIALLDDIASDTRPQEDASIAETRDHTSRRVSGDDSDGDESDGEQMRNETQDVLYEAMDEVAWEKANKPRVEGTKSVPLSRDHHHQTSFSPKHPALHKVDTEDTLRLPTVPSDLQDQPDVAPGNKGDEDFAADIASRMAALQGLGSSSRDLPSAPTSQVDDLGLPVVPSFAPGDRPIRGVVKRVGYTDADQKTWCIVCLEDGTIRCLGCDDDDVYCARCWKEMHVGPQAGYDERGHQWETFKGGK
jgi:hypothetical protein